MKLVEKILLATDFSNSSNMVLDRARTIAKKFNSEIIPLHVIPEGHLTGLNDDMIKAAAKKELDQISKSIMDEGIPVNKTILKKGVPFYHIIEQATLNHVNVILLGSGEHSQNDPYPLGITADKVMQKSNKPVWVVKHGSVNQLNTIVCAVDFSNPSRRALNNAIHVARQFQAELKVVHVIGKPSGFYATLSGSKKANDQELVDKTEKHMETFLKSFDFYNVDFEKILTLGNPDEDIVQIVKDLEADLLLMGSSGKDEYARIQMGSVAKKVVRQLPASLLTFKSENVIQLNLEETISNISSHYNNGVKLLENGFTQEALQQFNYCIEKDVLYAPAYSAIARVYERMSDFNKARSYALKAKDIREKLEEKRIEADIRGKHPIVGVKTND